MNDAPDPNVELLDELRTVLGRVDPTPPDVTEFARAALGWRRLDADLAELLADSALETEAAALTRSAGALARWLSFQAADLAIEVEVQTEGDTTILLGQLTPAPAAATVEAQTGDGSVATSAETDRLGRFRLTLETVGRIRLRVVRRDPAGPPVETSWLSL